MKKSTVMALFLSLLFPAFALAHTGFGDTTGFLSGFGHPIGGADHVLAMVAVGLWAAQFEGRRLWAIPCTFVGVMILGGLLGFAGVAVPFIEEGIMLSVLILGVLIAGAFRFPLLVSALVVGFFAVFHGHAHGAEMPVAIGAASYTIGFALATALLHSAGVGLGVLIRKANLHKVMRLAGGALVLGGIYLVIA